MLPKQYKLTLDPDLGFSFFERKEAFLRMARAGVWVQRLDASTAWWMPNHSKDAAKRIEREGFILLATREIGS